MKKLRCINVVIFMILMVVLAILLGSCSLINLQMYSVSGNVTTQDGDGVPNVEINFGSYGSVITDSTGNWIKEGLKGLVVVTPKKSGYIFEPLNIAVDKAQNIVKFLGCSSVYKISGRVIDSQTEKGILGVKVKFSNEYLAVETDYNGRWSIEGFSCPVIVTPEKEVFEFSPPQIKVQGESDKIDFEGYEKYTISGKVISQNGKPISDVIIKFSEGSTQTKTNTLGVWTKSGLFGQVMITASKEGWVFSPENSIVKGETDGLIFTGIETYSVSGKIIDNENNPIQGVEVKFSDGSSVITNSSGYWVKYGLSGEITITPKDDEWIFDPLEEKVSGPDDNIIFSASRIKWFYKTHGKVWSSPAIGDDGTIYFGCDDAYFYAVKPSGELKWDNPINVFGNIYASPAISDSGMIYFGTGEGYFYEVSPDGDYNKFKTDGYINTSVAIDLNDTIFVTINYYKTEAFSRLSVFEKGYFTKMSDKMGYISSSLVIGYNNQIYIADSLKGKSQLYKIDAESLNIDFMNNLSGTVRKSPVIGSDGSIYICSSDRVYGITKYGDIKFDVEVNDYDNNLVIGYNDIIYSGLEDYVVALDSDSGEVIDYELIGDWVQTPAVGKDGTIYVGTYDGHFCALELCSDVDFNILWCLEDLPSVNTCPVIANDGTIYIGTDEGVYAICSKSKGLASSSWPSLRHDNKNTGNVNY